MRDLFSSPSSPSTTLSAVDKVERTMEEMRRDLEKYEVLVVGWSGGKDSTAVVELACQVFPQKQIYALHVWLAGAENPIFREFLENQKVKLEKKHKNLEVRILTPKETYWTLTIGRGYSLPHKQKRFCQRVKIQEAKSFMMQFSSDEAIQLIGIRAEEHYLRAHSTKFYQSGKYAPILDWTTEEVWEFLLSEGHKDLWEFYRDYYGRGECPYALGILDDRELSSTKVLSTCSGRSGCWTCTLISPRRLYEELEGQGLELLGEFMMCLHEERDRPENRLPFTPKRRPIRKGHMGMYTLSYRAETLRRLLLLRMKTGLPIIEDREIDRIFEEWEYQLEMYGKKTLFPRPPWISPRWKEVEKKLRFSRR